MENRIKLTVIIPHYNSWGMLRKTLDNEGKRARNDIEWLVVDDMSTEDTYGDMEVYQRDSTLNLRLYKNEKNYGPGVTRNIGIKKAKGEYITFLDADDWFSEDFINEVFPYLDGVNDCILFDLQYVSRDGKKQPLSIFYNNRENARKEDILVWARGGPVCKIYKTNILIDNNIEFEKIMRCEDIPFTKVALAYCNKFVYINKPLYNYYQNENSITHNDSLLDYRNACKSMEVIYDRISKMYPIETEAIYIQECVYATGLSSARKLKRAEWKDYVNLLKEKYPDLLKNPYYPQYTKTIRLLVRIIFFKQYWLVKIVNRLRDYIVNNRG